MNERVPLTVRVFGYQVVGNGIEGDVAPVATDRHMIARLIRFRPISAHTDAFGDPSPQVAREDVYHPVRVPSTRLVPWVEKHTTEPSPSIARRVQSASDSTPSVDTLTRSVTPVASV